MHGASSSGSWADSGGRPEEALPSLNLGEEPLSVACRGAQVAGLKVLLQAVATRGGPRSTVHAMDSQCASEWWPVRGLGV